MSKLLLGVVSGFTLGLLDGASAIFNPAAASLLTVIIISATAKGAITGGVVGLLARKFDGVATLIGIGAIVGGVLSILAAMPTGSFLQIVPAGIFIGLATGLIVAKWGR